MIRILENQFLRVSVADLGAELSGIFDKEKNHEVLWQADPAIWPRKAPVLFPNVGRHYNNMFHVNGKEYPAGQHGFARDMELECVEADAAHVVHRLKSNEETKKAYPFDFTLEITHTLTERTLSVGWKVVNSSDETMYFTIGGHPGFMVPAEEGTVQSDYFLTFEGQDALTYLLIDPASGTAIADEAHTLALEDGKCKIDAHMFDKDALIFDGQIARAGIAFPDGRPYLEMSCAGFPNFGIWSKPGAPFVCLEPWMGRCDDKGFEGELKDKKNINAVDANQVFEAAYSIKVF